MASGGECTEIAHCHSLAMFHRRRVFARNFHTGDHFPLKNRRKIPWLAIFDHTEIHIFQEVPNPTPLNPTPATCHKRKRKLRCNFRKVALQKLHYNIRFSAVRKSILPKAALQQAKNCSATLKKLRCRKVALSCRFPADFKLPRLGPAQSLHECSGGAESRDAFWCTQVRNFFSGHSAWGGGGCRGYLR